MIGSLLLIERMSIALVSSFGGFHGLFCIFPLLEMQDYFRSILLPGDSGGLIAIVFVFVTCLQAVQEPAFAAL